MEILHITSQANWRAAMEAGAYSGESLASEGFIHCSTPGQVERTANKFYAGQFNLLVLHIDTERLAAELRWEAADGDEFPHIYGPLNLSAVDSVTDFGAGGDGMFHYP